MASQMKTAHANACAVDGTAVWPPTWRSCSPLPAFRFFNMSDRPRSGRSSSIMSRRESRQSVSRGSLLPGTFAGLVAGSSGDSPHHRPATGRASAMRQSGEAAGARWSTPPPVRPQPGLRSCCLPCHHEVFICCALPSCRSVQPFYLSEQPCGVSGTRQREVRGRQPRRRLVWPALRAGAVH